LRIRFAITYGCKKEKDDEVQTAINQEKMRGGVERKSSVKK
jgi:hypothetical protein